MSTDDDAAPEGVAPPHRTRLSIPAADVSTIRWLTVQDNVSASVRALVRAHIAREGYTDPTCTPVEQQLRRGRPKGSKDRAESRRRLRQLKADSDAAQAEQVGEVSDASIEAHRQREQLVQLGLAEGWLVVDEYGEAVCVECRSEFDGHTPGCWHEARCRSCRAEPGYHREDCPVIIRDLDFDDDGDKEPAPRWDGPPLHQQITTPHALETHYGEDN